LIPRFRRIISSYEIIGFLASLGSQLRLRQRNQEFYSQSKEDSIISRFCPEQSGHYVDVGSGRPISGSNSYYFYKKGWDGVLIDPIRRNERLSRILRPRDQFHRVLVGAEGNVTFYETYPYEYSTTSSEVFKNLLESGLVVLRHQTLLKVSPFSDFNVEILDNEPSFLSIDAEGADFEVLQSNNWSKYKPRVICIESPQDSDKNSHSIVDYLDQRGYQLVEQTQLSKVFVSKIYLQSFIGGDTPQHLK
jgi:hypothetical protein